MAVSFKGAHFPQEIILMGVRWYVAYPAVPLLFVPLHTVAMLYDDLRRAGIPQQTAAGKLDFHALRTAYINLVWDHGATPPEALHLARHRTAALTISPDYGYARTRETRLQVLVEGIAQQKHGFGSQA